MLVNMAQQAIENLAFLMNEQVLEGRHLLFVEQLCHDLEEVAAEDRKWLFIGVQELA